MHAARIAGWCIFFSKTLLVYFMGASVEVQCSVRTGKTEQHAILPVNRICPIAEKITFQFMGFKADVERINAEPLVFGFCKALDACRQQAIGLDEIRCDGNDRNRSGHDLPAPEFGECAHGTGATLAPGLFTALDFSNSVFQRGDLLS